MAAAVAGVVGPLWSLDPGGVLHSVWTPEKKSPPAGTRGGPETIGEA